MGCKGYQRHWFTAGVGLRAPVCERCGAIRPGLLDNDEWAEFVGYLEGRYTPEGTRTYWLHLLAEAGLLPTYERFKAAR